MCVYTNVNVYIHIHRNICMYVQIFTCEHKCTLIYIYIYIYIYMYNEYMYFYIMTTHAIHIYVCE